MKIILVAALVAIACAAAARGVRAEAPRFEDYPVTETFRGAPVAPVLSTSRARRFRTELRRQAARGPNFAGHFTLARWGCGAGCVTVAVIDAISGEVQFAPFSFEDAYKDGRTICHHGSALEITSELFIVEGEVNGTVGRHYFRWHDRKFTLVHFQPGCSL